MARESAWVLPNMALVGECSSAFPSPCRSKLKPRSTLCDRGLCLSLAAHDNDECATERRSARGNPDCHVCGTLSAAVRLATLHDLSTAAQCGQGSKSLAKASGSRCEPANHHSTSCGS